MIEKVNAKEFFKKNDEDALTGPTKMIAGHTGRIESGMLGKKLAKYPEETVLKTDHSGISSQSDSDKQDQLLGSGNRSGLSHPDAAWLASVAILLFRHFRSKVLLMFWRLFSVFNEEMV